VKGRKTLRRAGIVLALGALLSAGTLASGALGMTLDGGTSTDSSSTATDATTTVATDTTSSTTTTTPSVFSPSIKSDQEDYNPGAIVTLTGADWGVGEAVQITVNDDKSQPWSYSANATADAVGGFSIQFQLPTSFAASYSVRATGTSGAVATTTFTDGNVNIKTVNVPSASVDWRLFNNVSCSGGSASSGTITAASGGNGTGIAGGAGATQSLRLTAGSVSGASFSSWDSGDFTTGDPSTANPVCLVGANGTQNVRLTYTAAPADTTAPAVTVTTHNAVPASGWFTSSPQQVDVSATDSSNVTNISCTVDGLSATVAGQSGSNPRTGTVSVSGNGTHPVVCTATDGGGNSGAAAGSSNTVTVKIDTSAPTITFDSATPAANGAGWNKTNVLVSWNCSDNVGGSGAAAASVTQTISAEGTGLSATGTCTDVAGNTASNTQGGFKIDKTDPAIVCPSPAPAFLLHQSPANVVGSFTDGGSGPSTGSASAAADTSSVGGKSVTLSATDVAGNTSTKSCAYTVGFQMSDLFAPSDKPNTMNVSTAGQAIPLKWRLTDAGGTPVTNLASATVSVTGVSCTLGTTEDLIEEIAAGSSGLQNLGDGYYQINWKSPTNYAGSCKSLNLSLAGEASPRTNLAFITFKK
jgi:hypothetical protein